jgi:hypothetical protein
VPSACCVASVHVPPTSARSGVPPVLLTSCLINSVQLLSRASLRDVRRACRGFSYMVSHSPASHGIGAWYLCPISAVRCASYVLPGYVVSVLPGASIALRCGFWCVEYPAITMIRSLSALLRGVGAYCLPHRRVMLSNGFTSFNFSAAPQPHFDLRSVRRSWRLLL